MALILIADDDPEVRDVVRAVLSEQGHLVGAVADGAEAVKVAELKHPALIILDCLMPEMNGVEALQRIRQSKTAHAIPILMLTARRGEADVEIALRAGATDYLKKPFDPDQLVAVVEGLLARAASRGGSIG